MPFCPQCREEFEEGIEVCFDCGDIPLVATLEGLPEPEVHLPGTEHIESEVRLLADSRELGQMLYDMLMKAGIPSYVYDDPVELEERQAALLAVPSKFAEDTWAKLRFLSYEEVETDEGSVRLYLPPDPTDGVGRAAQAPADAGLSS